MKSNTTLAKVITMMVELKKNRIMELVTTVDPIVTPEMAFRMYGLPGRIIKSEETNVMPLPFALAHSANLQRKLGYIH